MWIFSLRAGFCAGLVLFAAAPVTAGEGVTITARDCRLLSRHVPDADVAHRPGVDVRGKKVAPADLGGAPSIELPEVIAFDVKVDLRNFLGGPQADADAAGAAVLAADDAAAAVATAETAATEAATAAAADPANAALAAASLSAAAALASAKAAVKPSRIATFAGQSAAAATQASAADPGNAPLAAAATAATAAAADATASSSASQSASVDAARIGETIGEPVIGRITVKGHRVYFNDQLLSDPDRDLVAEACRKKMAGRH
jgi:hypothetical protein